MLGASCWETDVSAVQKLSAGLHLAEHFSLIQLNENFNHTSRRCVVLFYLLSRSNLSETPPSPAHAQRWAVTWTFVCGLPGLSHCSAIARRGRDEGGSAVPRRGQRGTWARAPTCRPRPAAQPPRATPSGHRPAASTAAPVAPPAGGRHRTRAEVASRTRADVASSHLNQHGCVTIFTIQYGAIAPTRYCSTFVAALPLRH